MNADDFELVTLYVERGGLVFHRSVVQLAVANTGTQCRFSAIVQRVG